MVSPHISTQAQASSIEFSLPDASTAAWNAIDGALEFCAANMKLKERDAALALLRCGGDEIRGYFEYGLARQLAEYLAALDTEVRAAYVYDTEATPEDLAFGQVAPTLVHVIILAQRKTSALNSLIVAVDRALTQRYADLMGKPGQAHLLDVQVVSEAEVNSRSGFGAMLTWLHHRPLMVWQR